MDEIALKLLEKALQVSPGDWDTRAHLIAHYLTAGRGSRAAELLGQAPAIPSEEPAQLLKAQVQAETDPAQAIVALNAILAGNKACARAYLLLARIFLRRGLRGEAQRKYGAATVIDDTLSDPAFEAELGLAATAPPPALVPAGPRDESAALVSPQEIAAAMAKLNETEAAAGPAVTFAQIGGMEEVIERVRMNIVYPFKNPELFRKFNKRSGGGILLYGPPGCGKTHLARATAGECGATFISIAVTDVLSKWLGESERHLHELFQQARRRAPTVIFLDEVDAIGINRSDAGSSLASVVNVLLTEMDGVNAANDQVMVLAATNMPWRVDSALRRPGRFDRVLFVPPPDERAREAIVRIHLEGLPAEKLDLRKLAQRTEKFSGADLRAVVERASEKVIAEELKTGRSGQLTDRILLAAAAETRPSTVEWLETARNYASYGNRSGIYDDLAAYLEKH